MIIKLKLAWLSRSTILPLGTSPWLCLSVILGKTSLKGLILIIFILFIHYQPIKVDSEPWWGPATYWRALCSRSTDSGNMVQQLRRRSPFSILDPSGVVCGLRRLERYGNEWPGAEVEGGKVRTMPQPVLGCQQRQPLNIPFNGREGVKIFYTNKWENIKKKSRRTTSVHHVTKSGGFPS